MPPKSKKGRRGRSKRDHDDGSDFEEDMPPAPPPRPFTEMEGLPVSVDEPEYNLLNNSLSLKDSAVLYSSLMKSRKAYMNGNIFELYWSKSRAKAENETNARDRMNKLCDCSLQAGPHTFDVRFFLLKDEEIEKKREQEKNLKKEKRLANKKAREDKIKARELKLQNRTVDGANIGPGMTTGSNGKPNSSNPNDVTSTSKDVENDDNDDNDANDESDESEDENKSIVQSRESTPQPDDNKSEKPPHLQEDQKKDEAKPQETKDTPKKALPPLQVQRSSSPSQTSSSSGNNQTANSIPKPRPPPTDPMQTPESQMMIANLNAIARIDPSLNALMKVVATGNAKPEQIKEFQGYIQRAKAMGPSASFKQNYPNYGGIKKPMAPPPAKVKKIKPPKEKQLTTLQELYVNGADLVFEFMENPNIRYNLPKDCIVEKINDTDFLISVLIVHNQEEINRFQERKRVRLEKQANKEKNEKPVKVEDVKPDETVRRSTRSKHDDSEKVKSETTTSKIPPKDEPKEPIPYFTALSFRLTSVSERYDPIFLNSFNKYEDVKAKMENILENGVRVPKYYIWYAVDAYKDEALAENLRNELYLVENPPKGKYKKRGRPSADEKLQLEMATKKVKV